MKRHDAVRCISVVLLLVCGAPSTTWGQQVSELPERLSPPTRAALLRVLDSARIDGLPVEALVAKAQEGVLKGADESRIVGAVQTLARRLGEARDAMAEAGGGDVKAGPEVLIAGAGALHAGLRATQLRHMYTEARAANTSATGLAQALVVAADLVTRGVPADLASTNVESLIARHASDSDLEALRRSVEHDIDAGMGPGDALAARTRALSQRLEQQRPPVRPPLS